MSGEKMIREDLEPLYQFIYESLGRSVVIKDFSRGYGRSSITWHIVDSDGGEYYLKRHEHRRHYQAEVRALTEWVPSLQDETWWAVPSVHAASDQLGAMIMTALPGSILEESRADPSTREKSFELAGRFANSLNSGGMELPSMPASQRFTDEQLDLYLLEVEPHVDGPTLRWIDTIIRRSDA